jgi:F-type H+-transporting ATPase subunit b
VQVLTLNVTGAGTFHVTLPFQSVLAQAEGEEEHTEEELDEGPSPIAPEMKELLWGGGSFIVLLIVIRLFLYPRLRKGLDARYEMIRGGLESADATRLSAEAELSEYNAELAKVRDEASKRIDAVRQTLEAERQARFATLNAELAERRAEAAAAAEAARLAARDDITSAAANVAAVAAQRVLGRPVDAAAAREAVEAAQSAGVR